MRRRPFLIFGLDNHGTSLKLAKDLEMLTNVENCDGSDDEVNLAVTGFHWQYLGIVLVSSSRSRTRTKPFSDSSKSSSFLAPFTLGSFLVFVSELVALCFSPLSHPRIGWGVESSSDPEAVLKGASFNGVSMIESTFV